jgi:centromeric protein E
MARPIVKAVLEGKHGTIFAYGQTGSGKTYSLHGRKSDPGLIELAAQDIFRDTQIQHFRVTVQYFEIYNEKVRDLIAVSAHQKGLLPELAVQEDGKGNVMVQAREECVQSVHDVLRYLQIGNKNRATFATRQNAQSSRSHAVVRFRIESRRTACGTKHVSVLNMIDLAGSENSSAAAVGGLRKREGGKINQSLLSLSQVVHALSLPQDKRPKYISFRNSKLTRILQPHLQGNAAIAVLCCISMHKEHVEESKSTLKFAADAKRIAVRPVVNIVVDNHEALISNLQQELAEAKKALCLINSRLKEEPKNEVSMAHANPVPAILDTRTHNVQCEIHNTSSASLSSSSSEASYLQSQLELAVSRVKFLEKQLLMSEELNSALVKSVKELEWRDNDHQALAQTRVGDVAVKSDVASDFVLDAMGDVLQMLVYCMLMQIVFLLSTGYALIGRVLKYSRHRTMDSTTSSPR